MVTGSFIFEAGSALWDIFFSRKCDYDNLDFSLLQKKYYLVHAGLSYFIYMVFLFWLLPPKTIPMCFVPPNLKTYYELCLHEAVFISSRLQAPKCGCEHGKHAESY